MLRSLDNPDDLTRYLTMKAERRRLDAEIVALEPAIYAALLDEDGATAEAAGYTLAVRTRKTYTYSPAADELADELKALRRYEEKARVAQCVKAAGYVVVTRAQALPPAGPCPIRRPRLATA